MHLTAINDKIRQTVFGLDYRGHLPADLLFHYDHVAKYAQKYYDDYRSQITELDQTFTSVAKALVLVLITQHYILPAWRQLWAVGPIGSLVAVYTAIRDVSPTIPEYIAVRADSTVLYRNFPTLALRFEQSG